MRRDANFANDKPVRPHPQGLPHEAANRQLARPFDVRRAALERDDARVLRSESAGVFHQHDLLLR